MAATPPPPDATTPSSPSSLPPTTTVSDQRMSSRIVEALRRRQGHSSSSAPSSTSSTPDMVDEKNYKSALRSYELHQTLARLVAVTALQGIWSVDRDDDHESGASHGRHVFRWHTPTSAEEPMKRAFVLAALGIDWARNSSDYYGVTDRELRQCYDRWIGVQVTDPIELNFMHMHFRYYPDDERDRAHTYIPPWTIDLLRGCLDPRRATIPDMLTFRTCCHALRRGWTLRMFDHCLAMLKTMNDLLSGSHTYQFQDLRPSVAETLGLKKSGSSSSSTATVDDPQSMMIISHTEFQCQSKNDMIDKFVTASHLLGPREAGDDDDDDTVDDAAQQRLGSALQEYIRRKRIELDDLTPSSPDLDKQAVATDIMSTIVRLVQIDNTLRLMSDLVRVANLWADHRPDAEIERLVVSDEIPRATTTFRSELEKAIWRDEKTPIFNQDCVRYILQDYMEHPERYRDDDGDDGDDQIDVDARTRLHMMLQKMKDKRLLSPLVFVTARLSSILFGPSTTTTKETQDDKDESTTTTIGQQWDKIQRMNGELNRLSRFNFSIECVSLSLALRNGVSSFLDYYAIYKSMRLFMDHIKELGDRIDREEQIYNALPTDDRPRFTFDLQPYLRMINRQESVTNYIRGRGPAEMATSLDDDRDSSSSSSSSTPPSS